VDKVAVIEIGESAPPRHENKRKDEVTSTALVIVSDVGEDMGVLVMDVTMLLANVLAEANYPLLPTA
jgi:hypothetical protein